MKTVCYSLFFRVQPSPLAASGRLNIVERSAWRVLLRERAREMALRWRLNLLLERGGERPRCKDRPNWVDLGITCAVSFPSTSNTVL